MPLLWSLLVIVLSGSTTAAAAQDPDPLAGVASQAQAYVHSLEQNTTATLDATERATLSAAASVLARRHQCTQSLALRRLALAGDAGRNFAAWYALASDGLCAKRWDDAVSGAYLTFRQAADVQQQQQALLLLGRAMESHWRYGAPEALAVYRQALGYGGRPEILTAVTRLEKDLQEQTALRLQRALVERDQPAPEICLEFNQQMPDPDEQAYGDYIRFQPPFPTSFRKRGNSKICATGAAFGTRYQLRILAGLKSTDDARLSQGLQRDLDTGDRAPALWFENSRYVLPRNGGGLPLHAINLPRVRLALYRIGDRNLLADFVRRNFRSDLSRWELERLRDHFGERLWQGEADLQVQRNRAAVTNLPMARLATPEPGVYLLTAKPPAAHEGEEAASTGPTATQWFLVSDIGLTSYRGADGLTVVTRSLASALPLPGVRLTLYGRNNKRLGEVVTDGRGLARFPAPLLAGSGGREPVLLLASGPGEDFNFFDVSASPFDLSDRGVAGRPVPGPLDAFLYTERGVYRPGDPVHLGALLRNDQGEAVDGLPLTLRLLRPDEQLASERVIHPTGAGGYSADLPLAASARTGRWKLQAFVDPKAAPVGETAFLVEAIVPPRIEVDMAQPPKGPLQPGKDASFSILARYLFGAPAAELETSGELLVAADPDPFPDHPGFHFGPLDEPDDTVRLPLQQTTTDADGRAAFAFRIDRLPAVGGPMRARLRAEVMDVDGRAVATARWVAVEDHPAYIGIAAPTAALEAGRDALFEVLVVDRAGTALARPGIEYRLLQEEVHYQWYREQDRWRYKRQLHDQLLEQGRVDVTAAAPARLNLHLGSGRFRLELRDPQTGLLSSVRVQAGWSGDLATPDTPDKLGVSPDRDNYDSGETARLRLQSPFTGFATLVIASDRVRKIREIVLTSKDQVIEVPIGDDWGAGAYALITAYRPDEERAGHGPRRAIGVAWLGLRRQQRALQLTLDVPNRVRPDQTLQVAVRAGGAPAGAPVYLTLAAVDEGVLQLTDYHTPDPLGHYFGRRRLGVGVRDLYGRLIDGHTGRAGRIRSGGGASGRLGTPDSRIHILALFSGIVALDPQGRARIPVQLPDFTGRLRLMAVAWSAQRVGSTSIPVEVRDPVVVMPSLPRFLAAGDNSTATVLIHNLDGPAGDYRVSWRAQGALVLPEGPGEQQLSLAQGERQLLRLPLRADLVGNGSLQIQLRGPNETRIDKTMKLGVRAPFLPQTRRRFGRLTAGAGVALGAGLGQGLRSETLSAHISVSPRPDLDVPGLLKQLDLYPYGCLEQVTSRALPLLYFKRLAQRWDYRSSLPAEERLADAVARILEKQRDDGGFFLWSPAGGEDAWLSAYALDFLLGAHAAGVAVPEFRLRRGLDWLRRQVEYPEPDDPATLAIQTYALYLLARSGEDHPETARYLLDEAGERLPGPMSAAQLGAALAKMGDLERAQQAFALAGQLPRHKDLHDYGSELRDLAARVLLTAETPEAGGDPAAMVQELAAQLRAKTWLSTQEQAWLVRAASALSTASQTLLLSLRGTPLPPRREPLVLQPDPASLEAGLRLDNLGQTPAWYATTVIGSPLQPPPPLVAGLRIQRRLLTLDAKPVDPQQLTQGDLILVLLEGEAEAKDRKHQALIVDPLPAGLEVESPNLAQARTSSDLDWLGALSTSRYTDALDDRFVAALDLTPQQRRFRLAYLVRAVTPGRYRMAPAEVEDMYRPRFRGRGESGWLNIAPRR